MKFISLFALAILASASSVTSAAPIPLHNDAGSGTVDFLAVGKPSALKIHGTGTGPDAKLAVDTAKLTGAIEFDMSKLDTGISLRTEHMKEKYLEVGKYPKSKLTLLEAPVDAGFAKSLSNGGENKFRGTLLLHGKEKEVAGTYTAQNGDVKAHFPITLSDFGIDIPKYLGITVADTVSVDVDVVLKK